MATGIFLFDKFLPEVEYLPFVGIAFLFSFLLTWGSFYFRKWRERYVFGVLTGLSFFLWGGLGVLYQRMQVSYEWDDAPGFYMGIVETVPEIRGKTFRAEVYVVGKYLDEEKKEPVDRTILLSWMPDSLHTPLSCGDYVYFYARISRPFSAPELTGFDYADYLLRKGISGTALAYAGNWKRSDRKRTLDLRQQARLCQQKVVDLYRSWNLDEDVRAVVSALTIGDKRELTPDLKAIYNAAGASHVLALSGLHVGILSGLLWILLYPFTYLKLGRRFLAISVVVCLWGFAYVSGLSASVVRAVTMCSLYALASLCTEGRFSGGYSLALAAFLMLLYNPFYLFDVSFQLSFAAVCSILAFYPLCTRCLKVKNRCVRYVWNLLCLSFTAQLGTLPLVLVYFGAFPTYFLLANLVVSPLAVCILALTLAAVLFSSVPVVSTGCVMLLNMVTSLLTQCMGMVQQCAGSQITSVYLSPVQALLLAGICICLYLCWLSGVHVKARDWIHLLVVCNLFLLACWGKQLKPVPEYLSFFRSEVYLSKGTEVSAYVPDHGLLCFGHIHVGVLNDSCWRGCVSAWKFPLDYAYVCRGFKGSLRQVSELFAIRRVILDTSLSEGFRKMLIKECQLLKISYTDLSVQGSYSVEL